MGKRTLFIQPSFELRESLVIAQYLASKWGQPLYVCMHSGHRHTRVTENIPKSNKPIYRADPDGSVFEYPGAPDHRLTLEAKKGT